MQIHAHMQSLESLVSLKCSDTRHRRHTGKTIYLVVHLTPLIWDQLKPADQQIEKQCVAWLSSRNQQSTSILWKG